MRERSKYQLLFNYLRQSGQDEITLTFSGVEKILKDSLPTSARSTRAWWSNRVGAPQSTAWLEAGYRIGEIDLNSKRITFRKITADIKVQRIGEVIVWNGTLIKALRKHMGLNQEKFAEEVGVRQQTVSEWETDSYQPRRSMSKYLAKIAEEVGFKF